WSTVSQLAYMAAGLAVGGWTAGVYHLLTHAAFKALLFLAAGSVLRSVGTNLMSEMGGLRQRLPVTFVTALIGAAALGGLPGFAVVLGLPVLPHSYGVTRWLDAPAGTRPLEVGIGGVLLTGAIAVVGAVAVVMLHRRRPADDPITALGRAARPLAAAFWVDQL